MSQMNEIEWINNYLGQVNVIKPNQIQSVLNFSLFWNLFEGVLCDTHANAEIFSAVVAKIVKSEKFDMGVYSEDLEYFRSRYITSNQTNHHFDNLNFKPRDKKQLVADVLGGLVVDDENVLLSLVVIVYRLRNNMFHGVKSLRSLEGQIDNFDHANQILIKLLDSYNT